MGAFVVDLADAVASSLNAAAFSQAVAAVRKFVPSREIKELKTLCVTVVPRGVEIAPVSRALDTFEYSVWVAVQKKLVTAGDGEIDELLGLMEEICDHLRGSRVLDLACAKIENVPIYADDHLDEMRAFTSLLTVSYRKVR